ncbi:MAG: HAMP domain-containing protein [Chloroflexi bacterium]|nr:MAG: HAMP domain-containing protein [Chloroflexota bacterium]
MFKSLRGRLFVSYTVIILAVLLVIALTALVIGSLPSVRYVPTLRELDAISRVSRSEILRLVQTSPGNDRLVQLLDQVAAEGDVRVVVARASDRKVFYDSNNNEWQGVTIEGVTLPDRLLPTTDANAIAGLFTHPDGSTWLVYSRPISSTGFGRLFVLFARPEPGRGALFQELGLFNLLIGSGCLAGLLAILLAFAVASWVSRPLQKLASATEAIAEGDYDQQLPLEGPAEVQQVAGNFNSMVTQVASTRQAQRDFLANVSHDLKTPITSIQGWSQALLDGTAVTPESQKRAASIIHNEAERMSRMVRQLLDLAKIESGQLELHKETVDLIQIVKDVHHTLLPKANEKQIHLTVETAPVPPICGDPDRLMQIFTNLADNALTHTSAGGRVHLDVHQHGEKAVEVIVQDTGKGIAPEELSRIFERFYQVDKSRVKSSRRPGSGLGLSIVQELVGLHNGRLQARSEVSKGSAFIVRLPVSDSPEASTIVRRFGDG